MIDRVRHERGILETSTVLLLPRIEDPEFLSAPLITAVTLAELSLGPLVATSDEERAARQAHLRQAEADFDQLPFDAALSGRSIRLLRRSVDAPRSRGNQPGSVLPSPGGVRQRPRFSGRRTGRTLVGDWGG